MYKHIEIELTRTELYCMLFTLQYISKYINTLKLPMPEYLYPRLFYMRSRELWNNSPDNKQTFVISINRVEWEYINIFTWNRASFMIHNQKELIVFNEVKKKLKQKLFYNTSDL